MSEERPPIFLTSAAAARAARKGTARPETGVCVGPGDHWSIQARPEVRRGELGLGIVWTLAPWPDALDSVRASRLSVEAYRDRYLSEPAPVPGGPGEGREAAPRCFSSFLAPGRLMGRGRRGYPKIQPGDTLTCCCGRKAAAAGECHRVWAAYLLAGAGWAVVLDGEEITEEGRELLLARRPR